VSEDARGEQGPDGGSTWLMVRVFPHKVIDTVIRRVGVKQL